MYSWRQRYVSHVSTQALVATWAIWSSRIDVDCIVSICRSVTLAELVPQTAVAVPSGIPDLHELLVRQGADQVVAVLVF